MYACTIVYELPLVPELIEFYSDIAQRSKWEFHHQQHPDFVVALATTHTTCTTWDDARDKVNAMLMLLADRHITSVLMSGPVRLVAAEAKTAPVAEVSSVSFLPASPEDEKIIDDLVRDRQMRRERWLGEALAVHGEPETPPAPQPENEPAPEDEDESATEPAPESVPIVEYETAVVLPQETPADSIGDDAPARRKTWLQRAAFWK